ncbi:inositol monophosphatase family protein [Sulfurovum sp.]|uniref:inositol monophosphatase family protein n=1 Tax=Sulfurovum sp. TaxID=1969726 RepID=UPI002A361137|nr:inositol monophosphatase family protein [Sulfurovum sp.]MDD2451917.1 inositol monophosphatase [Sulfurovum sp.]MDD3500654.1 inositol monophosphatase [Sulfurovum sp.]MDY0401948.1 inositol monophosphatase family protein [Sulfurovum sp.]
MTPFIAAVIEVNKEIFTALQNFDSTWLEKNEVGAGGDVSSNLDLFAEEIFVKHLGSFGMIESEESGLIGEGEEQIIIDPIDGSSNALSQFPYFGTSVAKINREGVLDCAVVCNLANGDLFLKEAGKEAVQGKLFSHEFRPLREMPGSEIGLFEKAYANGALVEKLHQEKMKFRAPGAVALSLAYAHSVAFVIFVGRFRIYDFAAGLALCEGLEVVVDEDYVIVSKNKNIVEKIVGLIQSVNLEE